MYRGELGRSWKDERGETSLQEVRRVAKNSARGSTTCARPKMNAGGSTN